MKRWWNIAFQVAATAGQLAQVYDPIIPPPYGGMAQGIAALIQATVGIIAHNFNPDGTPSQAPYIPPVKPVVKEGK